LHQRQHGAAHVEDAACVQVHHQIPGGVVGVGDCGAHGESAGDIEQAVDAPELFMDSGYRRIDPGCIGEVGGEDADIAALGQIGACMGERALVAVEQGEAAADPRQCSAKRNAEIPGGAGGLAGGLHRGRLNYLLNEQPRQGH
jgi:hypothetical protein